MKLRKKLIAFNVRSIRTALFITSIETIIGVRLSRRQDDRPEKRRRTRKINWRRKTQTKTVSPPQNDKWRKVDSIKNLNNDETFLPGDKSSSKHLQLSMPQHFPSNWIECNIFKQKHFCCVEFCRSSRGKCNNNKEEDAKWWCKGEIVKVYIRVQ